MELDEKIYQQILELCEEGDSLVEDGKIDTAIERYMQGLKLLPNSVYDWEAATWIYTALGDAYFLKEDYKNARNNLIEARKCPDGLGNPFILLRLGESFYELGDMESARNYLLQAYMLEGNEIFDDEPRKYKKILKRR